MSSKSNPKSPESDNGKIPTPEELAADLTAFALQQPTTEPEDRVTARLQTQSDLLTLVDDVRILAKALRDTRTFQTPSPSAELSKSIEQRLCRREEQDEEYGNPTVSLPEKPPTPQRSSRWSTRRILLATSIAAGITLIGFAVQYPPNPPPTGPRGAKSEITNNESQPPTESNGNDGKPKPTKEESQTAPNQEGKVSELASQFNELLDQQRYEEAERIAHKVKQLDPNSPTVEMMVWKSRFVRRMTDLNTLDDSREHGFFDAMESVEASSTPFDDSRPIAYPNKELWGDISVDRTKHTNLPAHEFNAKPTTLGQLADSGTVISEQQLESKTAAYHLSQFADGQHNSEQYDTIVENEFITVGPTTALSTFSIDVDTASYANVRRFLNQNSLPPANAVRTEELINYFRYDYPQPKDNVPFSVNLELAVCPWKADDFLLRIGLKGREIEATKRPAGNLVFLLDVSGSMRSQDKLPLLKRAMHGLVDQLREDDQVTIVTYAGAAGLRLDATSGDRQAVVHSVIESLNAGGSTNGSAGIELAYEKAIQYFITEGANRVILATDGDLNVGISDDEQLIRLIEQKAKSGVFLTVLGFGTGNLKDSKLEKLADHGNGVYSYIDSLREARRVLVEQIAGSLVTIAKDVKIQVEFNPAEVHAYRLIGYENRALTAEDFHDDTKDAGEIGAGHTVTALYQIQPIHQNGSEPANQPTDPQGQLKYQRPADNKTVDTELAGAAHLGELLTVGLRYKMPDGDKSSLIEFPLKDEATKFTSATDDYQFAAMVAAFGMLLRQSPHVGDFSLAAVEEIAGSALSADPQGRRAEFVDLVRRARQLSRE